jgi:hypothetical protein
VPWAWSEVRRRPSISACTCEPRSRHPVRMPDGDGAAVDVEPVVREAEPVAAVANSGTQYAIAHANQKLCERRGADRCCPGGDWQTSRDIAAPS